MKHRYSVYTPLLNLASDLLLFNISFFLSYFIRFNSILSLTRPPYIFLWIAINITWLVLTPIIKPYSFSRIHWNFINLETRFLSIFFAHVSIIALFIAGAQAYYYSRLLLITAYILFFTTGTLWRILFVWIIKQYRLRGYNLRKFIVVGGGGQTQLIIKYHESHPELGFRFMGSFGKGNLKYHRGEYENVTSFIKTQGIDYVYCYSKDLKPSILEDIINSAYKNECEVKILADTPYIPNRIDVEYYHYIPIFRYLPQSFYETKEALLKRTFDVFLSGLILLTGFPIWMLIGIITTLSSKGPMIFKQERVGLMGKPFMIYKFRSMKTGAAHHHSAGHKDSRITKWGHFLRRTRLDEIPQFINVLKGDMSIVGPRPLADYDAELLFSEMSDEYRLLLSMLPGITSIGQIEYGYASSSKEVKERVKYDLKYIPSMRQDISLIFRTVKVILSATGK